MRPVTEPLPPAWQQALERDSSGIPVGADPAPERRAARLLAAFIAAGLVFLVLPGTLIGVLNLISISSHQAAGGASTAWIQAHGQAQLLGWVVTFILGISLYTLPKFRGRALERRGLAWLAWALWTTGVAWRWWSSIGGGHWRLGLVLAALLELAAFALVNYLVFVPDRKKRSERTRMPNDLGSLLGMAGFGALLIALVLNVQAAVSVALHGALPVYPAAANRAYLTIVLWGFTVPVAWGYSGRFVTIFLGLREPSHRAARWLAMAVTALAAVSLMHWWLAAAVLALAASAGAVWALRVLGPSERQPKLAGVYRHYPAFIRLAFVWLLVGAAIGVLAELLPAHTGLGGASRHAVTVGFLSTLIFSLGPRILPSFLNSRELFSPRLMAAALWLLTAGCTLRVSSEIVAYSAPGGMAWSVLPASAVIELSAVLLFAANIALSLAQRVPAWFPPESVNGGMSLYWHVASYPATRQLLVKAGLATLGRLEEVPRSLTLAEAAAADSADLEAVLAALRKFYTERQPRRLDAEQQRRGELRRQSLESAKSA